LKLSNGWLLPNKKKRRSLYFEIASNEINENDQAQFEDNTLANTNRKKATIIHNEEVKTELFVLLKRFSQTKPFSIRRKKQIDVLKLPLFPTTTIGSFPQTAEVRSWRAKFKTIPNRI
jgi:5-methyltetrahydropteroyltriglutamate--homocysteine methyltransferase